MVITKRYNSVERFTSMSLSEGGVGGGGDPTSATTTAIVSTTRPMSQQQLTIPPQTTWINHNQPPQQQAQQRPPPHITLARRPSNEQLLQPQSAPSPTASTPHSLSIGAPTMIPMQQQSATGPSPSFFQQQYPQQYSSTVDQPHYPGGGAPPQPQPRSIMRPPSQTATAGPYPPAAIAQKQFMPPSSQPPSRQSYLNQYGYGPAANQFGQKGGMPQQMMHSPRPQSQPLPHLSDVYSQSHNNGELAENMRSYFARKVPAPIWLTLSGVQIIAGIVSLFIGALNAGYYNCVVEPNIPIYLIISGILLIVNGGIRLFFFLTSSSPSLTKTADRRPNSSVVGGQRRKGGGGRSGARTPVKHLCEYALEGTVLFAIVVVVILGCVWVYGAQRFMHTQRYVFENHYCHQTVYWTAWWSVTLHLGFFALLILGAIILLLFGALMG